MPIPYHQRCAQIPVAQFFRFLRKSGGIHPYLFDGFARTLTHSGVGIP
jgi:hypothetical protein